MTRRRMTRRRVDAMLKIEAMNAKTLKEAENIIVRLATVSKSDSVCVEAIKAVVAIAARPVTISGCSFKAE